MNDFNPTGSSATCCMNMHYGYSYVLPQKFTNLYTVTEALCNGTLFKDLNLPISVYGK